MGRPNNKAAFRSLPFTRILAFYRTRRPGDGPTVEDFALCHDLRALNGDNLAAAVFYNECAAAVFADNFVAQGKYACKDQPLIRKQFLIHLNGQLQNQYIGKKGTTETRRIGRRRAVSSR